MSTCDDHNSILKNMVSESTSRLIQTIMTTISTKVMCDHIIDWTWFLSSKSCVNVCLLGIWHFLVVKSKSMLSILKSSRLGHHMSMDFNLYGSYMSMDSYIMNGPLLMSTRLTWIGHKSHSTFNLNLHVNDTCEWHWKRACVVLIGKSLYLWNGKLQTHESLVSSIRYVSLLCSPPN